MNGVCKNTVSQSVHTHREFETVVSTFCCLLALQYTNVYHPSPTFECIKPSNKTIQQNHPTNPTTIRYLSSSYFFLYFCYCVVSICMHFICFTFQCLNWIEIFNWNEKAAWNPTKTMSNARLQLKYILYFICMHICRYVFYTINIFIDK